MNGLGVSAVPFVKPGAIKMNFLPDFFVSFVTFKSTVFLSPQMIKMDQFFLLNGSEISQQNLRKESLVRVRSGDQESRSGGERGCYGVQEDRHLPLIQ